MNHRFQPESVDLAMVAESLRATCGPRVLGEIVGRTWLRDEVVRLLRCSELEAEMLVDTMIGRGFVVRCKRPDGVIEWVIEEPGLL